MQIVADNAVSAAAERAAGVPPAAANLRVSTLASNPSPTSKATTETVDASANVAPVQEQPLLTFRQDAAGRTYYVITDPQTGREIGQLPPEEIRDVGEGIAAFVKKQQEESASSPHVATKV